jgi:membrane-bound serine protease (ClpP class)
MKYLFLLVMLITSFSLNAKEYIINSFLIVNISSSINPATVNFLETTYKKAELENQQAVIIKLNTPGGLVSSTKKILTMIGKQEIPTIIWITPEGASATSAGAIIASASHYLSMSNGTNIGASTPIQMTGEVKNKDLRAKAINDLVALVKGLSEARGRNGKFYGEMVSEAKSFSAKSALEKKVINSINNNLTSLLKSLNGHKITIKGDAHKVKIPFEPRITKYEMDLGQKLLNIFADPNMTYILLLIGAALLYLELQAPGGFIAGCIGIVCLILAGIGLQILPLNFGALALIVLSFFLFLLEAYIVSYGVITLIALAALISGSLFLFRTEDSYIEVSRTIIFSASSAIATFVILIGFIFLKDIKNKKKNDFNELIDKSVTIISLNEILADGSYIYKVKVNGEIWNALSKVKRELNSKAIVIKQDKEKMILNIN